MDKYAIQEGDIYNFDETGFQMGILSGAKCEERCAGLGFNLTYRIGTGDTHSPPRGTDAQLECSPSFPQLSISRIE
jgi:hypothetical protein